MVRKKTYLIIVYYVKSFQVMAYLPIQMEFYLFPNFQFFVITIKKEFT